MNKKAVLVLVMFVLFVASIVSGKLYWNKKVANATRQTGEVKDSKEKKEEKVEKKQDAKTAFKEVVPKSSYSATFGTISIAIKLRK